jgi:hypothetical protein
LRARAVARRHDEIDGGQFRLAGAEQLADQSSHAIALHRIADRLGSDRKSKPGVVETVRERRDREHGICRPAPARQHAGKLRGRVQALGRTEAVRADHRRSCGLCGQGIRRLRPFARRRFSTRRPFLVAMRARKPWVRARRTLLG